MMHSENLNEIFSALSKAQIQFNAAVKDAKNPFFKSNYADLNSVFEACREPLSANGLCISQLVSVVDEKNVLITILGHSSGQWIKSHSPIITSKNDAQGFGAGITYIRRYALVSMLGISQEDDDGESTLTQKQKDDRYRDKYNKEQASPPKITFPTKAQVEIFNAIVKKCPESTLKTIQLKMAENNWESHDKIPLDKFQAMTDWARTQMKKDGE